MGGFLYGENAIEFYKLMQKPVRSQEELTENVRMAVDVVAEGMHIAKVAVRISVAGSGALGQADDVRVLYQGTPEVQEKPLLMQFQTGDGGSICVELYACAGYTWNEEEETEVRIVGNQIYTLFSQCMMSGLLRRAMMTDPLVGIPNLSGFMDCVARKFAAGEIENYYGVYLNIHNFKYVNKVLSYIKADEVMKQYAKKLSAAVESDEFVARLGGDNFGALIREENLQAFVEMVNSMEITYTSPEMEKTFSFSATIGASQLRDMKNPGEIMLRISVAYQVARQREYNGIVFYSDELYKEVMQEKETIARFERALKDQEFVVYYQPKIKTEDKSICGAEALVRWNKAGQLVPPLEFIPILEKEGTICKLDIYVLNRVCKLLDRCRDENIPLTKISVNFSRKHVENPMLVEEIVSIIDRNNIPHQYLEIELTESEDYRDYVVMSKIVNDLKALDISTSIDDFGTGYSSLNMLKMTNVDLLKIDKSFIPLENDYEEKQRDIVMFENIARMAKELGIKIIAEGVETQQQYDYLVNAGCDMIQGYFFDKPLSEEQFLERLRIGHY